MSNTFRPRSGFSNNERYASASLPVMKMRLENEIIRKREAETRRSETARSNDRYFQQCNLQNEKFDDWTSPRSMQLSHRQSKIRESEIEVEDRRAKLKKLYYEDKLKQEKALKKIQEEEESLKWEKMKDKVQHFRQSKSIKLKEMVETREHEQWKSTSVSFRAFESELKKQQQQEVWKTQLQQKEDEKILLADEKRREAAQMERLVQEEKKRQENEQKIEFEKKKTWKKNLDEQIELLKSKDSEADEKRREHDNLLAEAAELEAVREEIRKKEEENARRKLNGEFLTKQHLAKLRQRSKEVAADLESEVSFAEKLFRTGNTDKERSRKEIERFLKLVEHHRQIEKERLQQTEFLFQEEAKRMWEKREQEWEAERLARKKLIDEVIAIQEKQIDDKLLAARREREQLLRDREELIQSFESYRNQIEKKDMESKAQKLRTKADLEAQIEFKNRREEERTRYEQQERQRQNLTEATYNEKHWNIAMDKLQL